MKIYTSKKFDTKFDTSKYLGKQRIYKPVPGTYRISKLYIWDDLKKEYVLPERGKCFLAKRYIPNKDGILKRYSQYFETLDEARKWQSSIDECSFEKYSSPILKEPISIAETQIYSGSLSLKLGMSFREVIEEWRHRIFPTLAESTRLQYEKLIRLHMVDLLELTIPEITPQRIDGWIDKLKAKSKDVKNRKSFDHELGLLIVILKYYDEYHEDTNFRFPIKKRHRKAICLNKISKPISKDFPIDEFFKFRDELLKQKNGKMFAVLATVQYFQALRISEAAAIHWEDLRFNTTDPCKSRLCIKYSVFWPRKKGLKSCVQFGFKNAHANGGVKEQPLFPESYNALKALFQDGFTGLVFQNNGKHLEYRGIQHAYNRAFKEAKLPYSATHVMRHGGCRHLYNEVKDTAVAQQLLGNSSLESTLVYAQRYASALSDVAETHWAQMKETTPQGGRNWSQIVSDKIKHY